MRILPPYKLANAVAITNADVPTNFQKLDHMWGYAVQANVTTGATIAGTLKLQASLDGTNWADISGTSQAVSAAGSFMWNVSLVFYPYVRAYFSYSSGSGTLTVLIMTKGY